jgi:predicted Zn finger-like uncharacterized protein
MIIQCPDCAARYRIDPTKAAKAQVRVKCPRCASVFEVAVASAGQTGQAAQTGAAKVLVVDDSKFFRELIADVLAPLSLQILMAADGVEALEMLRSERPSLVILDLNLPRMSGHELIRTVRADDSLRGVRLLAMSGVFRKETDAVEVQAAGADDFLSKSFKPEQLQFRVKKLLEGGR